MDMNIGHAPAKHRIVGTCYVLLQLIASFLAIWSGSSAHRDNFGVGVVSLGGLGFKSCQWGFPLRRSGKKEWGLFPLDEGSRKACCPFGYHCMT